MDLNANDLRRNVRRPFKYDYFDALPDDLVVSILSKLASSASSPAHFINVLFTCKRLNRLALHRLVLAKAGPKVFSVKARNWSECTHRFLKLCVNAGNIHACYTLGMIHFYCLEKRKSGVDLMRKAAMRSHAAALYSLAVIQFNGSGGSKEDINVEGGVVLCARASLLGHSEAIRELGNCLQEGYGVRKNVVDGQLLLIQANVLKCKAELNMRNAEEEEEANGFMREWFESGRGVMALEGLRLCGYIGCGRPETRPREFRRFSVCRKLKYCSHSCQSLHWRLRQTVECSPFRLWLPGVNGGRAGDGDDVAGDLAVG